MASKAGSLDLSKVSTINESSCCIIPPEELWDRIQAIREEHDKSYSRWMPHINLIWPFLQPGQFHQAKTIITNSPQFQKIKPFKVQLKTFHFTPGSKYLYLSVTEPEPENEKNSKQKKNKKDKEKKISNMELLYSSLSSLFPNPNSEKGDFVPHLTVGQISQDIISTKCKEFQSNWDVIEFEVKEIYFIHRNSNDQMMEIYETIELGQGN